MTCVGVAMNEGIASSYPWLDAAWTTLAAQRKAGRVPQALLIHGAAGLGKAELASRFARDLLCAAGGESACGDCHSCHLFAAGSHPDYQYVAPEEPGKAIKVDAIRKLINDLALKPQYAGYRVFVIDQADQMNLSSANALLKTLEEPADMNLLLLVSERPGRLPATILSRCQKLMIRGPRAGEALRWLAGRRPGCDAGALLGAARGSPLRALALADTDVTERRGRVFAEFMGVLARRGDPVAVAEGWLNQSPLECLDWMLAWVTDLVRLSLAPGAPRLLSPDQAAELARVAAGLEPRGLMDYWLVLLRCRRGWDGQTNRQLLLEEALIRAARLGAPGHHG